MWFWTLAPSVVLALVLLPPLRRGSSKRVSYALVTALLFSNIISVGASTTRWLESPFGNSADRTHFDLAIDISSLNDDLAIRNSPASIEAPTSELTGTDDDRVLINYIDLVLSGQSSKCLNCVYDGRNGSVSMVEPRKSGSTIVFRVGASTCPDGFTKHGSYRSFVSCFQD